MASLFHQNMRTFGGGAAVRNAAFNGAFNAINGAVGNVFLAIGYTEITNPNAPLRGQLLALGTTLDAGMDSVIVMEVGQTALGMHEYAGIVWDSTNFTAAAAGQVSYDNLNLRWQANAVAAPLPATIALPHGTYMAVDQRGPAFIAGTTGGNEVIIMFMHNMYGLGDRSRGFNGMPLSADAIRAALGGNYVNAPVFAGGDYNIRPRFAGTKRGRDGNLRGMPFRAARAGAAGAYINTTAANPYDFWLANDVTHIPEAWATVRLESRIPLASDHAGIRLRIS
ncbi:hypothetical protein [Sphingomonas sp. Leaf242]|uniref:hypothetical protein n=1 Tax=Sphingomonas sp. Leaf242 TaxID=1736304 RepID=UPI0007138A19|nr:hypothetical protein [Sphingomonas sp. Leaf242]KQO12474.1 hypothetical protein ASF09_19010 [Sphingomonas sp. Leaf242]